MPNALTVLALGVAAGVVASAVMERFQTVAAEPFGAMSDGDPATVKAADSVSKGVTGEPLTQKRRAAAGRLVHYATGTALGVAYVALVEAWPDAAFGFGAGFGLGTALALDDLAVPALGWGTKPTDTPLNVQGYSLASHIVFGVALEGVRRAGVVLLA